MALTEKEEECLAQVLIYHYRKDSQFCGCGWGVLGHSHVQHVIDVFKESIRYLKEN